MPFSTVFLIHSYTALKEFCSLAMCKQYHSGRNSNLKVDQARRMLLSRQLSTERWERSSSQFRCDMWSVSLVSSRFWLSMPRKPLQINSYPNFSICCVGEDPIHCLKNSPPPWIELALHPVVGYSFKAVRLKRSSAYDLISRHAVAVIHSGQ